MLAEVALALARNRQGAGPLETLKLSQLDPPSLAGPSSIPPGPPDPPRRDFRLVEGHHPHDHLHPHPPHPHPHHPPPHHHHHHHHHHHRRHHHHPHHPHHPHHHPHHPRRPPRPLISILIPWSRWVSGFLQV